MSLSASSAFDLGVGRLNCFLSQGGEGSPKEQKLQVPVQSQIREPGKQMVQRLLQTEALSA
jgi:hypothetical protein